MATFSVSHPHLLEAKHPTLRVFVTRDQIDDLGSGTVAFAQQLLDDLDLATSARTCVVTPFRSQYFSGFPDDPNWQDAWPIAWQVDIGLTTAPRIPRYDDAEIETSATDDSFRRSQHYLRASAFRCVVIGDFRRKPQLERAEAQLRKLDWKALAGASTVEAPVLRRGTWMGRGPQLQVDLGVFPASFYEAGATYAKKHVEALRAAGACVNVEDI